MWPPPVDCTYAQFYQRASAHMKVAARFFRRFRPAAGARARTNVLGWLNFFARNEPRNYPPALC